jgi:hypothetical protein
MLIGPVAVRTAVSRTNTEEPCDQSPVRRHHLNAHRELEQDRSLSRQASFYIFGVQPHLYNTSSLNLGNEGSFLGEEYGLHLGNGLDYGVSDLCSTKLCIGQDEHTQFALPNRLEFSPSITNPRIFRQSRPITSANFNDPNWIDFILGKMIKEYFNVNRCFRQCLHQRSSAQVCLEEEYELFRLLGIGRLTNIGLLLRFVPV